MFLVQTFIPIVFFVHEKCWIDFIIELRKLFVEYYSTLNPFLPINSQEKSRQIRQLKAIGISKPISIQSQRNSYSSDRGSILPKPKISCIKLKIFAIVVGGNSYGIVVSWWGTAGTAVVQLQPNRKEIIIRENGPRTFKTCYSLPKINRVT